jgi:hypothetical protein
MATDYDINNQFNEAKAFLGFDFIGADSNFLSVTDSSGQPDPNHFLYQLQLIKDRQVVESLPVMEQVCGFNWLHKLPTCIEVPKIDYTLENGTIVKTVEMQDVVTGNNWIPEMTSILNIGPILDNFNTLVTKAMAFQNKILKFGLDYTAKTNLINTYICNANNMMVSVGNLYLTINDGTFLKPRFTQGYMGTDIDGNSTFIEPIIIFTGLKDSTSLFTDPNGLFEDYNNYLKNFITELGIFNASATAEDKDNFLINPANVFSYESLKAGCATFNTLIQDNIMSRIELIDACASAVDNFDKIIKIISTVAIVYNSSTETNALQRTLLAGNALVAGADTELVQLAYNNAIDTKKLYPASQAGTGLMIATKKSLNHFDYYNTFENIIDLVFEQGIPQYDKITT